MKLLLMILLFFVGYCVGILSVKPMIKLIKHTIKVCRYTTWKIACEKSKKIILIIFGLLFFQLTFAQQAIEKYDTVIVEKNYASFYSYSIKAPAFVVYKLYKGGGKCSRVGMIFKSSLPHFNYKASGYDIGHMTNAEDFAYNTKLEENTFRFYNAIPQTPHLNRGIWKSLETQVRKYSQTDSLLIICGGLQYNKLVPAKCFKIVYSLTTGKILCSFVFNNSTADIEEVGIILNFDFNKFRKMYFTYNH